MQRVHSVARLAGEVYGLARGLYPMRHPNEPLPGSG